MRWKAERQEVIANAQGSRQEKQNSLKGNFMSHCMDGNTVVLKAASNGLQGWGFCRRAR